MFGLVKMIASSWQGGGTSLSGFRGEIPETPSQKRFGSVYHNIMFPNYRRIQARRLETEKADWVAKNAETLIS